MKFATLNKLPPLKSAGVDDLMDEQAAADRLGVSRYTLARRRKDGEIAFIKLGGRFHYTKAILSDYIARVTVQPCPTTNASKSVNTTSPGTKAPPSGKPLGSTPAPDKHGAHHLAQSIFGKPKSA